jgi:hypothetical protein
MKRICIGFFLVTISVLYTYADTEIKELKTYNSYDADRTNLSSKTTNNSIKSQYYLNSAIFIRPIEMYKDAQEGTYGINIEAETAYNKDFSMKSIISMIAINSVQMNGITLRKFYIGPQYNMKSECLNGLVFGIYPGTIITTETKSSETNTFWGVMKSIGQALSFSLISELSYNAILNNGISIGGYLGLEYSKDISFNLGIKLGYSYVNKIYKVFM